MNSKLFTYAKVRASSYRLIYKSRLYKSSKVRIPLLLRHLKAGLGLDAPYQTIVTSSAFVLVFYFYIYSISSYLKLPIVIFQNGVTYNAFFENTYLIDKYWDYLFTIALMIVWLVFSLRNKRIGIAASLIFTGLAITTILNDFSIFYHLTVFMTLPFIISVLVLNQIAKEKGILNNNVNLLTINYFSIIIIISSVIGIFLSSSLLLFSVQPSSVPIHNYTYPPYVLISNLSPVLILIAIFSLFINILIRKSNLHRVFTKLKESNLSAPPISGYAQLKTKAKFLYLLTITVLSLSLFLIPHNPAINETNQIIGVDTDEYMRWVSSLVNSDSFDFKISQVFVSMSSGDRPLTLLFLLLFVEITTIDDPSVIEYFPMILLPLFILTVFFVTKELFSNDTTALFSAFLSGVSFHFLIGMYAGLYANWLALIVGYLAIMLFFKYLKRSNQIFGILFLISIIVLLFTHVYTWVIINTVLVLFIVYSLKVGNNNRKKLFYLLAAITISIVVDIVRIQIIGTSNGIEQMNVFNYGVSFDQYDQSWENLTFAILIYVGGIFSNFVIYVLVICWSLRSNIREPSNIFMYIFLSIGIIPIFIGNEVIQSRLFFDIPFQIPAAVALTQLMKTYSGRMMAFSLCMWILFICVRTLFHLYHIAPK